MSIINEDNKIKEKQLPELDDEMDLIREKISKMSMEELWGPTTLMDLLDK